LRLAPRRPQRLGPTFFSSLLGLCAVRGGARRRSLLRTGGLWGAGVVMASLHVSWSWHLI